MRIGGSSRRFSTFSSFSSLVSSAFAACASFFCFFAKYGFAPVIRASAAKHASAFSSRARLFAFSSESPVPVHSASARTARTLRPAASASARAAPRNPNNFDEVIEALVDYMMTKRVHQDSFFS
jgi:hypothetical protein